MRKVLLAAATLSGLAVSAIAASAPASARDFPPPGMSEWEWRHHHRRHFEEERRCWTETRWTWVDTRHGPRHIQREVQVCR